MGWKTLHIAVCHEDRIRYSPSWLSVSLCPPRLDRLHFITSLPLILTDAAWLQRREPITACFKRNVAAVPSIVTKGQRSQFLPRLTDSPRLSQKLRTRLDISTNTPSYNYLFPPFLSFLTGRTLSIQPHSTSPAKLAGIGFQSAGKWSLVCCGIGDSAG